jgi:hypothetical protein
MSELRIKEGLDSPRLSSKQRRDILNMQDLWRPIPALHANAYTCKWPDVHDDRGVLRARMSVPCERTGVDAVVLLTRLEGIGWFSRMANGVVECQALVRFSPVLELAAVLAFPVQKYRSVASRLRDIEDSTSFAHPTPQ